ncbi:hypothetical protein Lepto7375DRAFT_1016 [Leptolyngbya sp. PCC 7375]|nr:hypothetical protein Lepto7375DRAFT_1016 [Leptolyngbya sp. PCC 7375]
MEMCGELLGALETFTAQYASGKKKIKTLEEAKVLSEICAKLAPFASESWSRALVVEELTIVLETMRRIGVNKTEYGERN